MARKSFREYALFFKQKFPKLFLLLKRGTRIYPPIYIFLRKNYLQPKNKLDPNICLVNPSIRPKFDLPKMQGASRNLLICTAPRSGSTLLTQLMTKSGLFGKPDEFFRHHHLMPQFMHRFKSKNIKDYVKNLQIHRTSPNGIFSVKIMFYQYAQFFEPRPMEKYFENIKYIRLKRRDVVAQAVSMAKANADGRWSTASNELTEDYLLKNAKKISEENVGITYRHIVKSYNGLGFVF